MLNAHPAPVSTPALPVRTTTVATPDDISASTVLNGQWWRVSQRLANNGDASMQAMRTGLLRGIIEGIDLSIIMGTQSFEEYSAKRAALLRSDLTTEQVIAKIDGYYAEPSNEKNMLTVAFLAAMAPLK